MKYLTVDTETTCLKLHPKDLDGNPYTEKNFLCYVGILDHEGRYHDWDIEYGDEPYGEALREIQEIINVHDCLVGFNIKFDLGWLHRYGLNFRHKRVFDTQLAEYIISNQSIKFPSLDTTAVRYGFEGKLDIVKTEFWEKGIDTDKVPRNILREYLKNDVEQTYQVFKKQQEIIPPSKRKLISLQNQDLLVLQEIEENGMLYNMEKSIEEGNNVKERLEAIDKRLIENTGFVHFNPASNDHVSVILFGGTIRIPYRESYIFTYKDGRTKEKERWAEKEYVFPRLIEPPEGSELKKEGFYSTSGEVLSTLPCKGVAKIIINLLLERASLEKLRGTYLHGIPKIYNQCGWKDNIIHGQLNQCNAVTGRLSSSKPNMQNMEASINYLFGTRYVSS